MEILPVHFLYPAELYVSKTPYQINTILGSCVAVCLFDPVTKIGGMNHYMLPYWNGQGLASPKYGNIAIEKLIDKLISMGCSKSNLKAKIFGGGEVIETQVVQFHIGSRNIEIARSALDENKIPIISSSVGGKLGRKIEFNTSTGDVRQKYVQKSL
jgi:chemotaxis protein CheD